MKAIDKALAWTLMLLVAVPWPVPAQQQEQAAPSFTPEQLDQIVAPIALYPDPLLAQIFMPTRTGRFDGSTSSCSWGPIPRRDSAWPPSLAR